MLKENAQVIRKKLSGFFYFTFWYLAIGHLRQVWFGVEWVAFRNSWVEV